MFARGLPILLIAVLLACPAFCGQGACGCAGSCTPQQERDGCDADCQSAGCPQHDGSDGEPSLPADEPCDSCQCICGGATLEKLPDVLPLLTQVCGADCWIAARSTGPTQPGVSPAALPDRDDGYAVSAREIRTLHMSLLC